MGVRGLNTFFNLNLHLFKSYHLFNTPLIFDGNNLLFKLYYSNNLDNVYGGDFNKFASIIKDYFSFFLECNIQPIVVFDGGLDKSDRKLETYLTRYKEQLNVTQYISKHGKTKRLLPISAIEVFKDVLSEMKIIYAQCDFEADDELPALANHYKCPILSEDSDFYLSDLHYGFVHLQSIELPPVKQQNQNGQPQYVLKCEIYHLSKFLSFFPGIDKKVLSLFGILIGNDYTGLNTFDDFYENTQFPEFKSNKLIVTERYRKMIELLCWLTQNNLEEAVQLILCHIKRNKREHVKDLFDQAIIDFTLKKCNLTLIIEKGDYLDPAYQFNKNLTTPCGKSLPLWFMHRFNMAAFPKYFYNIITMHRMFLQCQVERISHNSSYTCSRYIRQILYGILLRHLDENMLECKKDDCIQPVKEYDQCNGNIKTELVSPVFNNLPMLEELDSIAEKSAKKNIRIILGENSDCFSLVPSRWKLFIGSMRYWLRNCISKPTEEFICALIISLVYFSLLCKDYSSVKHNSEAENLLVYDNAEVSVKFLIKNISPSLAKFAFRNLRKYLKNPLIPFELQIVHCFSELQTCILYIKHLNALFNFPFVSTKIHKSMEGIFVYNLTKDIKSSKFPSEFVVSEILGSDSVLYHLFLKLKDIILEGECSNSYLRQKKKKCPVKTINRNSDKKSSNLNANLKLYNRFEFLNSALNTE